VLRTRFHALTRADSPVVATCGCQSHVHLADLGVFMGGFIRNGLENETGSPAS